MHLFTIENANKHALVDVIEQITAVLDDDETRVDDTEFKRFMHDLLLIIGTLLNNESVRSGEPRNSIELLFCTLFELSNRYLRTYSVESGRLVHTILSNDTKRLYVNNKKLHHFLVGQYCTERGLGRLLRAAGTESPNFELYKIFFSLICHVS